MPIDDISLSGQFANGLNLNVENVVRYRKEKKFHYVIFRPLANLYFRLWDDDKAVVLLIDETYT